MLVVVVETIVHCRQKLQRSSSDCKVSHPDHQSQKDCYLAAAAAAAGAGAAAD